MFTISDTKKILLKSIVQFIMPTRTGRRQQ